MSVTPAGKTPLEKLVISTAGVFHIFPQPKSHCCDEQPLLRIHQRPNWNHAQTAHQPRLQKSGSDKRMMDSTQADSISKTGNTDTPDHLTRALSPTSAIFCPQVPVLPIFYRDHPIPAHNNPNQSKDLAVTTKKLWRYQRCGRSFSLVLSTTASCFAFRHTFTTAIVQKGTRSTPGTSLARNDGRNSQCQPSR